VKKFELENAFVVNYWKFEKTVSLKREFLRIDGYNFEIVNTLNLVKISYSIFYNSEK